MAALENITNVHRKTDFTITFNYLNSDNTARPLTGHTVLFTVKDVPYDDDADDSTALIAKTVTSHTNAAGGITEIALTDDDTNLTPMQYFYDIVVVESSGERYRAKRGRFEIVSGVGNRIS